VVQVSSFLQPFLGRVSNLLGTLPGLSKASMFNRMAVRRPNGRGPGDALDGDAGRRLLRAVVAAEIVPRLIKAHQVAEPPGPAATAHRPPDAAEVHAFARLCASDRPPTAADIIDQIKASGRTTETVFLNLITPAARHLGEQWESDDLSFTQVTTALVLMHQVIHGLGCAVQGGPQVAGDSKRVMLACAPGSTHLLGLVIVSDFFRSAGWHVVLEIGSTDDELQRAVTSEWFDLVGVSVALESQLLALPALVAALKAASLNTGVPVLLGGPIFTTQHHDAGRFGAVAICTDPRAAVKLARSLPG
jgi:methanogenic corrinoid protein MtbC1